MRMKANYVEKPGNFIMDDWQIEKVVELSYEEFSELKTTPCQPHPFIAENKDCMFHKDGIIHGLLALGQSCHDGVLIDAEGYGYARIAAYVPGARDIVNAELDRAADHIIREGTENTSSGNWIIHFSDLEKQLGLTLCQGNGLYEMLLDKLNARQEVLDVEMGSDCIDTAYCLDFCPNLDEEVKGPPSISLARKALLFDNALSAVLDLYEGDDRFTMLHGSIGLTLEEIGAHHYLNEDDLQDVGPLSRKVIEGGLTVRELLQLNVRELLQAEELSDDVFLMNDQSNCRFSLDGARQLIESGESGLDSLLDVCVTDIEDAPNRSTNLIISGLTVEELFRLHDAIEAQQSAEQAMGPSM